MKRFVPKYLDPASRLGEILFGLIMVLTVTLSAGLTADEGRAGVRQLLAAAIGCNLAWGIIDAVMYVMNCITERSGKVRLIEAVQRALDARAALDIIQNEVEPELQSLLDPEEREAFSRSILNHVAKARIAQAGRDERRPLRRACLFLAGLCVVSAGGNSILHFFPAAFRVARLQSSFARSALLGWAKMGAICWD